MRRLIAMATLATLLLPAPAVFAVGGITPISPKRGDSVPAGKRPTFKLRYSGPGKIYVHVCKSRKKDEVGLICSKESIGKARKDDGRASYKPKYWLNNPGAYYWQAHRISCENGIEDCRIEGPIVKFTVR
jgi:hypothetical protein